MIHDDMVTNCSAGANNESPPVVDHETELDLGPSGKINTRSLLRPAMQQPAEKYLQVT